MAKNETARRYTIGQAVYLLDCDRVTLMDWLQKENMQAMPDPRDKRSKLLTREQLLELARVHGKTLHDDTANTPRLTGVQRDMLTRIQRNEKDIAGLKVALEIVQAVAELESTTFPGDWNGYDYDDVKEIVIKARALLGKDISD